MKRKRIAITLIASVIMVCCFGIVSAYAAELEVTQDKHSYTFDPNEYYVSFGDEGCDVNLEVSYSGTVLEQGEDYIVDNLEMSKGAGTYNIDVIGINDYDGMTGTVTMTIKPRAIKAADLDRYNLEYEYNGKYHKWKAGSFDYHPDGEYCEMGFYKNRDYTVKSITYKNTKYPGYAAAKVTLEGKGNYKGTVTKTIKYKIVPKHVTLKTFKKTKTTITASWNKRTTQTSGYVIKVYKGTYYSDMDEEGYEYNKLVKTIYVKPNRITSKKITGLKSKTHYRIAVMPYKNVDGRKIYAGKYNTDHYESKFIKTK